MYLLYVNIFIKQEFHYPDFGKCVNVCMYIIIYSDDGVNQNKLLLNKKNKFEIKSNVLLLCFECFIIMFNSLKYKITKTKDCRKKILYSVGIININMRFWVTTNFK